MALLVLLFVSCLILDINSQNQKPILSVRHDDQIDEFTFACEISKSKSVTADFICNLYTGENPQPYLQQTSKKGNSGKTACRFIAKGNEVFIRLQSVNKYEVSCDYSLTSDSTARSLMSDKYTPTRFFPTQPSIPAYVPRPWLSVSAEVLTERGSVQLHCKVPHRVKVSQCFFYPEEQDLKTKVSPSCQLSVIGSELIMWTGLSSPGPLQMICFYTVNYSGRETPSPHSLPVPVTVLKYQKPILTVSHDDQIDEFTFLCEIPKSESVNVTADFICNLYTEENPQPYLQKTSKKGNSGKTACRFIAKGNEVFIRLQSVNKYEVSCDYSLTSDSTARSLMSDKYTLTRFFPKTTPTTEESTTDLRRVTTPSSVPTASSVFLSSSSVSTGLFTTKHTTPRSPILMVSVLSVCVSLAGMISFCLCCFIKKHKAKRRKVHMTHGAQGVMTSMFHLNLSGLDAAGDYSLINSVPLSSFPLDLSGDGKEDLKKTEDEVYHVYCSISDTQPVTRDKDKLVYSLAQAH